MAYRHPIWFCRRGGDFAINMFGANMKNQHIGGVASIVTDPAHSMADPEPAVLAARAHFIGRRA